MNTKFFINGRCYKTPCKTVLNADTVTVMFFTGEHTIVANVSDKCYFVSIDNISLSDIKCDFHFSRNYTKPKEFLSNLYDTLDSFISTSITFLSKLLGVKRPICKNTDEIVDILFEEVIAIDRETADSDPDVGTFVYDVVIHNFYGSDTYTVRADSVESAGNKALKRFKSENDDVEYDSIDSIRIYKENSDELLKEIICEKPETEPEIVTDPETAIKTESVYKGEKNLMLENIRPFFYFIEHISEINVDRFCVDVMCGYVYIGYCVMYIQYGENDIVKKALCKSLHIHSDFRDCGVENTFLRMLVNEYNGLFCVSDNDDDYKIYSKIAEECKTPETFEPFIASGEKCFYISPEKNNKKSAINSMYGITANTSPKISNEYDETKELLAVEQFERLTGTLYKSLFKAIGLEETRRIPIIISNNMVFFNYNGMQYKYNPAQCKVYKKSGRRYLRINWKDFADDNSSVEQKQAHGRSPPFTPDIRSATIQ